MKKMMIVAVAAMLATVFAGCCTCSGEKQGCGCKAKCECVAGKPCTCGDKCNCAKEAACACDKGKDCTCCAGPKPGRQSQFRLVPRGSIRAGRC